MGKVGVGKKKGKSKNAGVGIDFKRVKHKVGKKLAKARNETDVNFKAHTINLPSQAVQQDKDGLALNFQNLSLQELLNQTGHYNEKVRKQALLGLLDLFSRHPGELRQHTHLFLTKVAERVGDGDSAVRLALRSLLREQALPNLEPGMVRPFMPVLMAHVSSAMTNLNMDVRLDALNFIDVLMDFVPELVVSGFQAPCLLHFCDLLSPAHRGRTIKAQSMSALLKVVMSLNSYLKRAYPTAGSSSSNAPETPEQQQQQQANKGAQSAAPASAGPGSTRSNSSSVLMHDRLAWYSRGAGGAGGPAPLPVPPVCKLPCLGLPRGGPPAVVATPQAASGRAGGGAKLRGSATAHRVLPGAKATGQAGSESLGSSFSSSSAASTADTQGLARRLVALLFECWSECGPSKAVEGPEVEPLQVLSGILSAVFTLESALLLRPGDSPANGRALSSPAGDAAAAETRWLSDVALRRVAPVFPAAVPAVKPSPALVEALVHFNLQSSQLLAMLLPCATQDDATWVQALLGFYSGVMEAGEFLPTRGMLSEAVAGTGAATNAAYLSVLRGVAAALHAPGAPAAASNRLLGSLRTLTARMPARSPVHAACLRLQHGLMQACRRGQLTVPATTIALWISPLPRVLWELGHESPEVSKLALCMLHDVARYAGPESPLGGCLRELQAQLAPLFCLHMPARKAQQQQQQQQQQLPGSCPACCHERERADAEVAAARDAAAGSSAAAPPLTLLPGPISKFPLDTQLLAIDLIYHLGCLEAPLLKALAPAIHDPRVFPSPNTALRLLEVTLGCMAAMEPATAASWALTLLFTDGLPPGSRPPSAPPAGDVAELQRQWQRQRQVVERTCAALPRWAPLPAVLQLLEPQLTVALAAGSAALSDAQRYSLIQLVAGLAPGGLQAGRVREVLPSACLDFYASQVQQDMAAAGSAAVLQVVGVHVEVLLLPLVVVCTAAGQEVEEGKAGVRAGHRGAAGAAAGAEVQQHGPACLRARFCAAAALLQQLLRCRALGPALQQQREAVRGGVAALLQRGQRSPVLSGDASCRAESKQLEQVSLDAFGP